MDETFDADRRRVGERIAVVFRWLFLVVLAVLNNLFPNSTTEAKVTIDLVLAVWAAMNVVISVLMVQDYRPGKQFSLTTMCLVIFFATGLVYLSDGFASPFFLALFLAVITNAVRFGATACIVSAFAVSFIYLFVGGGFTSGRFAVSPNATLGQVFLFLVVALVTGYMTRELERQRRLAVSRAAQADSLRELSISMVSDTDIKDIFRVVLENGMQMTNSSSGRMVLATEDGFAVAAAAERGTPAQAGPEELDEGLLSRVARSGEAEFGSDRKSLVIPIASGEGVTALIKLSRSSDPFGNEDLFAVNALSGSSAVALANALRYQRRTQEATTDGLTGLSNVRELRRRLEAAFARPDRRLLPLSMILVDFDHFKSVNDLVGHQHGDSVLKAGARIVRTAARAQDLVARYGGDELAVMIPDATAAGARRLAERIVSAVHAADVPTTPGNHLTFSIGVATYPDDALTPVELVAAADQALYLAKRAGKDRACTFAELVADLQTDSDHLVTTLTQAGPQVVVAVAHAVDDRNPITRGHSSRVAAIAEAVAKRSGFPVGKLEDLRTAAFLHDVGHIRLVTDGQSFELPGHPEVGEHIIAQGPFGPEIASMVRHHHERWDGTGQPDGLGGELIPIGARILAIAETYEATTGGRGTERLSPPIALERIITSSGTAFDPTLVEVLKRTVQDGSLELVLPAEALPAPTPA
jgi:diguanylate cyclase (GGDEF)-like protein